VEEPAKEPPSFGLEDALRPPAQGTPPVSDGERRAAFARALAAAEEIVARLEKEPAPVYRVLPGEMESLSYFRFVHPA
jgi:hypothetical protein